MEQKYPGTLTKAALKCSHSTHDLSSNHGRDTPKDDYGVLSGTSGNALEESRRLKANRSSHKRKTSDLLRQTKNECVNSQISKLDRQTNNDKSEYNG